MPEKKRILILANSSSGLYEFRGELILALLREGYTVSASLPETEEKERLERLGCRVILTPFERRGMNPLKDLALYREYRKLLKTEKPFLVLTYTIKPNAYGGLACRRAGIPYLANITGLGSALESGGLIGAAAAFLLKRGLKAASAIFVQNRMNLEFVLKKGLGKKGQVRLLPGSGVNLERFSPLAFPEKTGFLFVSRVMREKGIEEFLSVAEKIKAENKKIKFTVLGACEEDYSERLKRLSAQGVIEYPGKVPDTRPWLKEAQCQIHPSFYSEGMSNVCLEAAASARAVITTDHPGCRETVLDGVSGFLVRPGDASSLEEAVRKYLDLSLEERQAMGLAGRRHMEEHFDRKLVVESYLREIKAVK